MTGTAATRGTSRGCREEREVYSGSSWIAGAYGLPQRERDNVQETPYKDFGLIQPRLLWCLTHVPYKEFSKLVQSLLVHFGSL